MGCALHDDALTYGCPGCEDYVDDLVIAEQVRERLAKECPEHHWVELEPTVKKCSVCGGLLFSDLTVEKLMRYLAGDD